MPTTTILTTTPELTVDKDGTKEWWLPGKKRHRTDGPAIEYVNGTKYWFIDGELHRTDGPAMIWSNGDKEWWLDGIRYYTFDEYANAARWTDEQIVEWKLTNEYT
jgi:hypothetical protein